jgi:hypothetical protein
MKDTAALKRESSAIVCVFFVYISVKKSSFELSSAVCDFLLRFEYDSRLKLTRYVTTLHKMHLLYF